MVLAVHDTPIRAEARCLATLSPWTAEAIENRSSIEHGKNVGRAGTRGAVVDSIVSTTEKAAGRGALPGVWCEARFDSEAYDQSLRQNRWLF